MITPGHSVDPEGGHIGQGIYWEYDDPGLMMAGFMPVDEAPPELAEDYEKMIAEADSMAAGRAPLECTPEPWTVTADPGIYGGYILNEQEMEDVNEDQGNATLMSASPKLLRLLKKAHDELDSLLKGKLKHIPADKRLPELRLFLGEIRVGIFEANQTKQGG